MNDARNPSPGPSEETATASGPSSPMDGAGAFLTPPVTSMPAQEGGWAGSRRAWLALGAAAALAGAGTAAWRLAAKPVVPGALDGLWTRVFETPAGQPLPMAGFRGRPLLVNFWATWCPPCVEELPLLNRFAQEQAAAGWQVLGLAVDQVAPVQSFLQRLPLVFPVGMAGLEGVALSRDLGNATGALPFTVVLGPDGALLQRKLGKVSADDLRQWAQALAA
jgi:thiol-disulfide isomerase/thioredoxin